MNITFLGTSAANAYPLAACRCPNCERARELGGPSLRRRSSVLISDDLLIDLGPDIITGSFLAGCSLANLHYCLQTHSHADHLDPSHFEPRTAEWAVVGVPRLHFYASAATARTVAAHYQGFYDPVNLLDREVSERLNLEIHQIEALQSFAFGSYRVTAFPANHDPAVEPLLYAVEGRGRSIFYGVDTARLPEETWQALHDYALRFDVVILDHTYGPGLPGSDHLSADQFIEHVARMRDENLLSDGARLLATHISHEGNPVHPELSDFAAGHGYEIAYDGLTI